MPNEISLRKTSLVDYPGRVSSVFFFAGCNLRCPWCHNRDLILGGGKEALVSLDEGLAHLQKRKKVLGGVVLSGGEPCIQDILPSLIAEIKKIPLPVKLDTNGTLPAMLEKLFHREETCPDYIALDLKTAPSRYRELLPPGFAEGNAGNDPGNALAESAALIRASGIPHEYRSLSLPCGFFTEKDLEALAVLADDSPWRFRPFRGGGCLDPAWDGLEASMITAGALAEMARKLGKNATAPE